MTFLPREPARLAPSKVDRLIIPDSPDIAFEGFGDDAFAILRRLQAQPHIEQYREEKEGIRAHIQEPFKRYRDDLVVNIVLPNRLNLETERNIFSRMLKNDFGAGGCHHHYWMSFYRPHRTRLTDIQLAHSLRPSGLRVAVFVGNQAGAVFARALERMTERRHAFFALVNPLLDTGAYTFSYDGAGGSRPQCTKPLEAFPDGVTSTNSIVFHWSLPADDVVRQEEDAVHAALLAVEALWPIYQFMLTEG